MCILIFVLLPSCFRSYFFALLALLLLLNFSFCVLIGLHSVKKTGAQRVCVDRCVLVDGSAVAKSIMHCDSHMRTVIHHPQ